MNFMVDSHQEETRAVTPSMPFRDQVNIQELDIIKETGKHLEKYTVTKKKENPWFQGINKLIDRAIQTPQ